MKKRSLLANNDKMIDEILATFHEKLENPDFIHKIVLWIDEQRVNKENNVYLDGKLLPSFFIIQLLYKWETTIPVEKRHLFEQFSQLLYNEECRLRDYKVV